jgi:hypothetical protein
MENAIQAAKAKEYWRDIAEKGSLEIKVIGNSMYPFLKSKDIMQLIPTRVAQLAVGEIILTYNGSRMLCHRVFKIKKNMVQTKADALIWPDLPVGEADLIGKVIARKNGNAKIRLDTFAAKRFGFLVSRIMIIGAFLYIPVRLLRSLGRVLFVFRSFQRQP